MQQGKLTPSAPSAVVVIVAIHAISGCPSGRLKYGFRIAFLLNKLGLAVVTATYLPRAKGQVKLAVEASEVGQPI